ncbi:MAG: DUF5654 family protein [Candidatus Staskawiczbacteria bacterium]|nr:DUF5654 family protein [Candidatus Staskawiczbacteria bacterium]
MAPVNNKFKKIAENQKKIGIEVKEKTMGYVLAALGFVVGLAWNDAMKALIETFFPLDKNNIFAKFIYALIVTVIIVVATILLTKKTEEEKAEVKK